MKCPKCGCTITRITMFDGPKSGGHTITCSECGHIIEHMEYNENSKSMFYA